MHSEFEALRETLLREGVAPRHVRRYLVELREHLADLTARERATGHDEADAAIRARAALGYDQTLSRAVLARPGSRSLSARAPWAVFGVVPVLAVIAGFLLLTLSLGVIAHIYGDGVGHLIAAPSWFRTLAKLFAQTSNGLGPLVALLFAWAALRRRMRPAWPLVGIALAALLASLFTMDVYFPAAGARGGAISISFLLGPHYPLTPHVVTQLIGLRFLIALLPAATLYGALRRRVRGQAPSA